MKMPASPGSRYSPVVMLLHWLIAILVIVNWRLATVHEHMPRAEGEAIMANHFANGIVILILAIVLIGWQLTHKTPSLAAHLRPWEAALARMVRSLFYILLIAMPVLGWIAKSSFGEGINLFGIFTLPPLPVPNNPDTGEIVFHIHATLGIILLILIALHILGTLKHTVFDRDGNIFRMLPFGRPKA